MLDRIFYTISTGFLLGIFFSSIYRMGYFWAIFLFSLGIVLFLLFFLRKSQIFLLFAVLIFCVFLGILRLNNFTANQGDVELLKLMDQNISLVGVITEEPDIREKNQKLAVEILKLGDENLNKPTKILVTIDPYDNYLYGDKIIITGTIKKPQNFIDEETGRIFDYTSFLAKDKIFYEIRNPNIEVIQRGQGNKIIAFLLNIKSAFVARATKFLSSTESGLLSGLILGAKNGIPETLKQNFINTGTIHIVALSGYNITVISSAVVWIFASFAGFYFSIIAGLFISFLFVLMTGLQATAIRAFIMASIAVLGAVMGRFYDAGRALLLAVVIMVLINPMSLVFDVSFQLSVLATFGIIYLMPILDEKFHFLKRFGKLREIVSGTLSAYIIVLPLILYDMGRISLVALPANILVLPLIPFTMLFGFLTGAVGFVSSTISFPISFLTHILLFWEIGVVNFLGSFKFSYITVPPVPFIFCALLYVPIIYYIWRRWKKKNS